MVKGASAASLFIVGVVLFIGSFLVGETLLYARGAENPGNHRPSLPDAINPVEFTFEASNAFFGIRKRVFLDSDDAVVFTSTRGSDSPSLLYHMTGTYAAGDTDLCGAIRASSTSLRYDGQLQTLDTFAFDSDDSSWEFNLSLEDGAVLQEGAECIITIHLLGWDEKRTRFLEQYRAENFVELTFRVDNSVGVVEMLKLLFEGETSTSTDTVSDEEVPALNETESESGGGAGDPVDVSNEILPVVSEIVISEATSSESVVLPEAIVEDQLPSESQTGETVPDQQEGQNQLLE